MNLQEQIEKLLKTQEDDTNTLLRQILDELKKVNINLKNLAKNQQKYNSANYYKFVKEFRKKMQPDVDKRIFPEVEYKGVKIGSTTKGFLYEKETSRTLSAQEAFEIYKYFYDRKENIDNLIKIVKLEKPT